MTGPYHVKIHIPRTFTSLRRMKLCIKLKEVEDLSIKSNLEKGVWKILIKKDLVMVDESADLRQQVEGYHWQVVEASSDQW